MRWKASMLSALLLLSSGLQPVAAEEPKTYPDMESCFAAEQKTCTRQPDGTWAPPPPSNGTGGEQEPPKDDPYWDMRTARSARQNWSGIQDNPMVVVDMDKIEFPDALPYLDHEINRVRVPIRFVAEAMGGKVEWEPSTRTVTITREQNIIQLTIDHSTALVNGQPLEIDAPPKLVQDRTMVPLRFIAEAFGAKVEWVGTEPPIPSYTWWGEYQVWIWIPWGYWGTATIYEREKVYKWWWHRDVEGT